MHLSFRAAPGKRAVWSLASALLTAALAAGCEGESPESVGAAAQPMLPATTGFATFESGQVRPLTLTPDKKLLLATNTPDGKLEIYKVEDHGLKHVASVPVGLEPVAVAARSDDEAWVVNHLSDSISIVKLDGKKSHVERTLLVGDEPRDIVFAGPHKRRAFVTTAHRGQSSPVDPQLSTPGVGRADVWVFDADDCHDSSLGGQPLKIITLFSDTPRALAVTPDGSRVYAAAFNSGNGTASTFSGSLEVFTGQVSVIPPFVDAHGEPAPLSSAIVKYDGEHWKDESGQIRDAEMRFTLPDEDVFVIDANASPPAAIPGAGGVYAHVGTTLFNMVVNPANGKVYVSNLESNNQQRFEGENVSASSVTGPQPSVRGHIAESRITVLGSGGSVTPRHLNKHIDYTTSGAPIPNDENARSVAFPIGMEITRSGSKLYVASLGTSEVAVYETSELEDDTFVPSVADQIHVSGGGPTGLALDEGKHRLYVLTRFDNSIAIVDTQVSAEIDKVSMFNPEPAAVVNGRRFLYDASFSSSHGDSACASCHMFGDTDHLGWNLGDPDGQTLPDPNVYVNQSERKVFHAMKGVMVTQSLRGMDNHGPMHWRGDRTGGYAEPSAQPNSGAFDENAAFLAFNGAFVSLLGRSAQIPAEDMQAFADFALELMYPPNPIRHLDNSLTANQQLGFDLFMNRRSFFDPVGPTLTCNGCHVLDRNANAGFTTKPGFFGTDGRSAEVGGLQNTKTPHLRNQYQKVGKFGMPFSPILISGPGTNEQIGDQIRGFGFAHDGSFGSDSHFFTLSNFADSTDGLIDPSLLLLGQPVVNPDGLPVDAAGFAMRAALDDYMMVFDSNLSPIVGQQVTLREENQSAALPRVSLLIQRAEVGECELIAFDEKGREGLFYRDGLFLRNKSNKPALTPAALRAKAIHGEGVTYTCAPASNGRRLSIDRDMDGYLDGDDHHPDDPARH